MNILSMTLAKESKIKKKIKSDLHMYQNNTNTNNKNLKHVLQVILEIKRFKLFIG